jgi:predicted RNA-binding protein YlqC (UPF0109 family)
MAENMEEAVAVMVRALVHHPEQVEVRAMPRDGKTTVLEIYVAEGDMGPLIGRQGRTIKSLRSVFDAISRKHHHRFILEIVE